jgi:hypothetical protein
MAWSPASTAATEGRIGLTRLDPAALVAENQAAGYNRCAPPQTRRERVRATAC